MTNTVPAILLVLFGAYCAIASRWIAQRAARQQSRLLSVIFRRKILVGPEHFRIPFMLGGIVFVVAGILAICGWINFKT